jgi:hypothetical protein
MLWLARPPTQPRTDAVASQQVVSPEKAPPVTPLPAALWQLACDSVLGTNAGVWS